MVDAFPSKGHPIKRLLVDRSVVKPKTTLLIRQFSAKGRFYLLAPDITKHTYIDPLHILGVSVCANSHWTRFMTPPFTRMVAHRHHHHEASLLKGIA